MEVRIIFRCVALDDQMKKLTRLICDFRWKQDIILKQAVNLQPLNHESDVSDRNVAF